MRHSVQASRGVPHGACPKVSSLRGPRIDKFNLNPHLREAKSVVPALPLQILNEMEGLWEMKEGMPLPPVSKTP